MSHDHGHSNSDHGKHEHGHGKNSEDKHSQHHGHHHKSDHAGPAHAAPPAPGDASFGSNDVGPDEEKEWIDGLSDDE